MGQPVATNGRRPRRPVATNGSRIITREIDSWGEFVNIIGRWPGFRNWCFRGQGQEDWKLEPSLTRHVDASRVAKESWKLQEERISRIFRRKCHLFIENTPNPDDVLEWLALMQHHGAPTRLLDFTWSPYDAIKSVLEVAGGTLEDVTYNAIFLKDLADYKAMNEIYAQYFPKNPPARWCIQAVLVKPEFLVEISSIAHVGT